MKQAKTKSVKTEAPISVKQHRSEGHSLETRVFERKILETFCVQPRCEFRGKRAAQGVCYDRKSLSGQKFKYLDATEKYAVENLQEARKAHRGQSDRKWVTNLESHFITHEMNQIFSLDELVRLRAENARLRSKLGLD